jgi:hypothetical protein
MIVRNDRPTQSHNADIETVNCSDIQPKQLIFAIYNDHQCNSLPTKKVAPISDKTFHDLFEQALILVKNGGMLEKLMNKIDVQLDFSTWPHLHSEMFDQIVEKNQKQHVMRRKLAELVDGIKKDEPTLTKPLTEGPALIWDTYIKLDHQGYSAPPEATTEIAVSQIKQEMTSSSKLNAIDVAAGPGRDTRYLLQYFNVLAIEPTQKASNNLKKLQNEEKSEHNLIVQQSNFETMKLDEINDPVSLINISYALPYAGPKGFPSLWKKIIDKLPAGGRFAGQFFGEESTFVKDDPINVASHNRKELETLFAKFKIEHFREEKGAGKMMDGSDYVQHTFHVVAQKMC